MLECYEDFVAVVGEGGFLPFSPVEGCRSLSSLTRANAWHTGDEKDPWQWRQRFCQQKHGAYGCLLGGHKGFIAPWLYSSFIAAFRPALTPLKRYERGELSSAAKNLYELFCAEHVLDTRSMRRILGVHKKDGAFSYDQALIQLQHEFYVTVGGDIRPVNKAGESYGWPSNLYILVEDWAPRDWLTTMPMQQGWENILAAAKGLGDIDWEKWLRR